MTSRKSLLEQNQDVEANEYAEKQFKKRPLQPFEDYYKTPEAFKAGHKYRDAEVDRLKRVIEVLWDAAKEDCFCEYTEELYPLRIETCWLCEALTKAEAILKESK